MMQPGRHPAAARQPCSVAPGALLSLGFRCWFLSLCDLWRCMALRLSADEWWCISDYLQSAALSHVCRQTWAALQRRHLALRCNFINVAKMMHPLKTEAALRTLRVRCRGLKEVGVQALALVKHAPELMALVLDLQLNELGDSGAAALAVLREAPALIALDLDLTRTEIEHDGAAALSALHEAPGGSTLRRARAERVRCNA